ncbi:DUF488 domain-containing protein [Leucobacter sp. gxy201]|uniref:DUF488 domain-containing protein n=1 Tax=Leucobacter sp. gxy201 TaxID=2957200 RepID=UPI003DA0F225
MTAGTIFTIGHSNHELDEFLELVTGHGVDRVVDVRKLQGSRRYPQFDADALQASLASIGVGFGRLEALTGRRPVSRTVPFEVNAWWQNRSFHNYADHALSPEFATALAELRREGAARRTAVMCSEAVWWRCHRRIIADHLIAAGGTVRHVIGAGEAALAELSGGAVIGPGGAVTYPGQGAPKQ